MTAPTPAAATPRSPRRAGLPFPPAPAPLAGGVARAMRCAMIVVALGLLAISACAAGPWSSLLHVKAPGVVVAGSAGGALHGFDARTGGLLWRYEVESPNAVSLFEHDGLVVVVQPRNVRTAQAAHRTPDLRVEALDARTGSMRWRYDTAATLREATALPDALLGLCVELAAPDKDALIALDLNTGAPRWTNPCKASLFHLEGNVLYAVAAESETALRLMAIDPVSGKTRFTRDGLRGTPQTSPALAGDTAVIVTAESQSGDEKKRITRHVYGVSTSDGALRYTLDLDGAEVDRVALEGSTLYTAGASSADRFTVGARDARSGREIARAEKDGALETPLTALPGGLVMGVARKEADKTRHLLLRLDRATLATSATIPLDDAPGESAPTEADGPQGRLLVAQSGSTLVGFALDSSKKALEVTVDLATPPLFVGNKIFFGDNNLCLTAIDMANPTDGVSRICTKAWFNGERLPNLTFVAIIIALIITFIARAKRDSNLFIRRLPGLNAIDDAVGRATEMGQPVLYVCGTQDVDEIETLAGLSILGHVARRAAEYETPLLVPTSRSVVMSTAQEVVREAHYKVGRPDSYVQDNIRYLTDDQFGYVAGVDGIMMRERPAANFYMGMFFGESLILAETGHATGAIQIAGTAQAAQLPFFVAACDYTLMGEELFAASAYLSRDPREVGSLKGQDYAKALIMGVILVASLLCPWWPQVKVWIAP